MNVDDLNLPTPVTAKLHEAGLRTVAQLLDAGSDGLQAIDGIGPKTANDVLDAAQKAQNATVSDGNGDTGGENNAEVQNDPHAQQLAAAPDGNGDTDPKVTVPAEKPNPNALVTVRNVSDAMLLVGDRYLLAGQRRTVRRRDIRHIAPHKLEVK
jgi:NAD-dependent DNA ligase